MKFNIIVVCVLLVFNYVELKGGATNQFILFTKIDVDLLHNIEGETWTNGREYQNLSSILTCEFIKTIPRFFHTGSRVASNFFNSLQWNTSEDNYWRVAAFNQQLQVNDNAIVRLNIPIPEKYGEGEVMPLEAIACNWNNFIVYFARNEHFLNSESYFMFLQMNEEYLGNKPEPIGVVMKFRSVNKINDGTVGSFYEVFAEKNFRQNEIQLQLQLEAEKEIENYLKRRQKFHRTYYILKMRTYAYYFFISTQILYIMKDVFLCR